MHQYAKTIATTVATLAGAESADRANLIADVARSLGMACVVFTQEDCPEGIELASISRDLEGALVTRGNEYIDQHDLSEAA